jgi:hypothetical protein
MIVRAGYIIASALAQYFVVGVSLAHDMSGLNSK